MFINVRRIRDALGVGMGQTHMKPVFSECVPIRDVDITLVHKFHI